MINDESYRNYQRKYQRTNPDRVRMWRIHSAINLLRQEGYTVTRAEVEDDA